MTLIRPALLAYEFRRLDGRSLPPDALDRWAAVRDGLGLTHPEDEVPPALPDELLEGAINLVRWAGRPRVKGPGPRPLYQSVLWTTGDDLCVSILLAPNDDRGWADLANELAVLPPAAASDLGGVHVYVALLDRPPTEESLPGLAAEIRKELPGPDGHDWAHRWSWTAQGFVLWEVPPAANGLRRLALVAHQDFEPALDAFSWNSGGGNPGVFGKYLLDAAKLRHLDRKHRGESAGVRRLRREIDETVDRLVTLHSSVTTRSAELVRADADLTRIRLRSGGLATALARLRTTEHGVDAAAGNIRVNVPVEREGAGPVRADLALAEAIRGRVGDDIVGLAISADAADRAAALTATAVQRGIGLNQQQLQLLQGSILGAILMVLAAVQALGPHILIPDGLKMPLVALLGGTALALPGIVVRSSRTAPRDLPLANFDYAALGIAGAGVFWFTGELVSRLAAGHLLATAWSIVLAGAGLVLFPAVARAVAWGRRPHRT